MVVTMTRTMKESMMTENRMMTCSIMRNMIGFLSSKTKCHAI